MPYLDYEHKQVNVDWLIMFSTIMTYLLMLDMRGLNWFEKLSESFWAT